jgi:ribosomal protein L18
VYRSNAYIYAQLIDDVAGKTLAAAHDTEIKKGTKLSTLKKSVLKSQKKPSCWYQDCCL